jgi:hypothetical protein
VGGRYGGRPWSEPTSPVAETQPPPLARVRDRARAVVQADTDLEVAIIDAVTAGHSLRRVGEAAGLSHEQVRRILHRHE